MKKIDILNFITGFRKAPNNVNTLAEICVHLGSSDEAALLQFVVYPLFKGFLPLPPISLF